MKPLSFLVLFICSSIAALAAPRVFCADEPEAKAFVESLPETFTASSLAANDNLFESWLTTLSLKTRLPIKDSNVSTDKYVVEMTAPQPLPGWDGAPVQYSSVIIVGGDGRPLAVLILAASDRALAKAYCANYLAWKFKPALGRQELRPGIFKEVPVVVFLYARQVFARDPDKYGPTPPAMQVFARIIN
jgi:hypothetical protein